MISRLRQTRILARGLAPVDPRSPPLAALVRDARRTEMEMGMAYMPRPNLTRNFAVRLTERDGDRLEAAVAASG